MKKDHKKTRKASAAAKIRKAINYYDRRTDDEAAREIETAAAITAVTWLEIPNDLLPKVM